MNKPVAFRPGNYYVSLSLTGYYCELLCPLCKGTFLKSMISAPTTQSLYNIVKSLYNKGARGFLLSGGFNREGYLMISKEHLKVVKKLKKDLEVVFSIHLGLAPRDLLEEVWSSGIDFIDFEVPPSDLYVKLAKNLPDHRVSDYVKFAEYALTLDKNFLVPHLIIDSKLATFNDEVNVLNQLSTLNPRLLVLLVEIRKGPWNLSKNSFERVKNILAISKNLFREVSLGCMRNPKFKVYDDKFIELGLLDRIANPRNGTIKKYGLRVIGACCSIERKHFKLFPILNK